VLAPCCAQGIDAWDPWLVRKDTRCRTAKISQTVRSLRRLAAALQKAVAESTLSYEFAANSYSFSAMDACMRADRALEVLRDDLEAGGGT